MIFQSCTKNVKTCLSTEDVISELKKSINLIRTGRYGPCIVDIPIDIQGSIVNLENENILNSIKEENNQTNLEFNHQKLIL